MPEPTTSTTAGPGTPRLRAPANRVSRRALGYWALGAAMFWALVTIVQVVILLTADGTPAALPYTFAATAVLATAHLLVMPRWRYAVHRWEVTEDAVFTRTGWVRQQWRIAPISRLQTVDVSRDPFQQLFGLAKVTITTASAAGPLHIHPLDREVAQELIDQLARTTPAQLGDAT
ncbi:hypothetical protein SAMN05421504_1011301 [Amycolatopsis xylanica]|uniref:YdbS-like PH domain-containing protein n=1 Tax=Amycolatopsis xylanica TaxID=589385 RepID=A0A1H2VQ82_9PSEU|nr:PH domain-containing protein [Amycolatopsis xylanica]SDW70582.1 hypothetical protein SAMN05421504_1011301 [Amycolatopsis xylanica]